jgi:hypothetical protein
MVTTKTLPKKLLPVIGTLLLMFVFAIAFRQDPLYRLNQHVYLLHGYADAGIGFLDQDWQSNTTDTVPVFSALVSISVQLVSENVLYYLFMINLAIFCFSILGIAREYLGSSNLEVKHLTFFILITLWYSGILESFILSMPGMWEYASIIKQNVLLIDGVAGQYILGTYFQPSTFGAFVVLSIYLFIKDKPFLAVISLAIASTVHSTYLLSSGVLTATYMGIIVKKEKDYRKSFLVGLTALVLVTPILIYFISNFSSTSPDIYAEAKDIIVNYRIPQHTLISKWFDGTTVFQIFVVGLAIYLVRRSKVFPILLISFLTTLGLSGIQALTGSQFLAVLFPWRISVYLVPIASAIIMAKLVSSVLGIVDKPLSRIERPLQAVLVGVILILGFSGVRQTNELRYFPRQGVTPAVNFVRSASEPGDLYLIPIEYLSYFRLAARVPVFVDLKSHPYKDIEVIEWYDRLNRAYDFYTASGDEACTLLEGLTDEYGINHVVFWSDSSTPDCGELEMVFSGGEVLIFEIQSDE